MAHVVVPTEPCIMHGRGNPNYCEMFGSCPGCLGKGTNTRAVLEQHVKVAPSRAHPGYWREKR